MKRLILTIALAAITTTFVSNASARGSRHHHSGPGMAFTMTNATDDNEILVYPRNPNGTLGSPTAVSTGGVGNGGGLGNQGGVILSKNRNWLLAVNAGSDTISVFEVTYNGIELTDTESSQGSMPVSLSIDDDLVYVLNAGDDSIAGFILGDDGDLLPIDYSKRPLSGSGVGAAQIGFSPNGRELVVTEKATNLISVFSVCHNGYADPAPISTESAHPTPFGFTFRRDGLLLVTEAAGGAQDAGAVSSYRIKRDDELYEVDPAVAATESATCWIALHPNQRFAYTTNTASNSISGYSVRGYGKLALLDEGGESATTGAGPIDLAFDRSGNFLYSLNAGDDNISVFSVGPRGELELIEEIDGLPDGANGLAVF
ncbi:beta-propeller fold lactonase family protein [Pelagicoccus sp. SDUM812003]|uniref:lactonase family protein n=1 Tax=Pelagicoccus sp. SDUM812003 TaxID=3041267 RepID=UPI00280FDA2D|nr:beta-propeller fold lactonase family protein [Pelagicoccus sp. SDUM812003]MDQ8202663.1 beta-propeller fold lactonase family protein [Pelagicoccus sp. SDUM812003]